MGTPRSAWEWYDLSPVSLTDNTDTTTALRAKQPGTIKEVWLGMTTLGTTGAGLVAVAKAGANILSATNVALSPAALVAGTWEEETLSTNGTSLKVARGDRLVATWTLTSVTSTNANATSLFVAVEPDIW